MTYISRWCERYPQHDVHRAGFDTDKSLARELVLWVNNDRETYRQLESIWRNMTRKISQNNFDPELAIKGFMWAAEAGAKSYAREFGNSETEWHNIFPTKIRRMAAEMLRNEFLAEIDTAPDSFEPYVFKKDVKKWQERYPQRRAAVQYNAVTDDEFDIVLTQLLDEETDILGIPGAYEVLSEHFNNDVMDQMDRDGGDFETTLIQMVQEASGAELLSIPGFYEVAAEAFNNDVLRRLHHAGVHQRRAFPDDVDNDVLPYEDEPRRQRTQRDDEQYGDYVEDTSNWLTVELNSHKGHQTFIDTPEDIAWLLEVHLPGMQNEGYESAVMYGNEDSPDFIELYWAKDPTLADTPRAFKRAPDEY